MIRTCVAGVMLTVGLGLSGCATDPVVQRGRVRGAPVTAFESIEMARNSDLSLADVQEVDLVEEVVRYRTLYSQTLKRLGDYYAEHGFADKQLWARGELEDLDRVHAYHYLLDSLPRPDLSARDNIAAANAQYEAAMALAKEAGHGLPALYNHEKMAGALQMLKQLIRDYPTSDKIDDAAFHCGEIYKEYYKNMSAVAVRWYELAWTWDPSTPHPARFQAAVTYDFHLHNRQRALELYRAAVAAESSRSNTRFALARIQELTVSGPVDGQRTTPITPPSESVETAAGQQRPVTQVNPPGQEPEQE